MSLTPDWWEAIYAEVGPPGTEIDDAMAERINAAVNGACLLIGNILMQEACPECRAIKTQMAVAQIHNIIARGVDIYTSTDPAYCALNDHGGHRGQIERGEG